MKTGRLLDILSGHEGPVHGLMFSPTNVSGFYAFICSCSLFMGNLCRNQIIFYCFFYLFIFTFIKLI